MYIMKCKSKLIKMLTLTYSLLTPMNKCVTL